MRQMIAEDYYDDDGYDDYDDDYVALSKKKTPNSGQKQSPKKPAKAKNVPTKTKPSAQSSEKGKNKPNIVSTVPPISATELSSTTRTTDVSTKKQTDNPMDFPVPKELIRSNNSRIPLTVVVLGHVDAGKSTITGHLIYAASNNSKTTLQREPTNFAWLVDEDEKERQHGVTMEIATKQLDTASKFRVVFQDAPGHQDFVPAMITGTAAADAALLTVDATSDIRKGQLREHVFIAKGLGVNQILALFNKFDLVGWDKSDKYYILEGQVREFLATVGYPSNRVRCLPLSGLSGVNIMRSDSRQCDSDDTKLLRTWYTGPTLWEALDNFDPPAHHPKLLEKLLRLVVSDVLEGSNAVSVRAQVVSGWIKEGENLTVLPVGDSTTLSKITSIHHPAERSKYFGSGEMVEGVLSGLEAQRVSTGSVLVRPQQRPPLATVCRVKLFVLDITVPLIRGAQVMLHMHYVDVPCHLKELLRSLDTDGATTKRERPRALTKNTAAIVELQLALPICMEAFADCRALGRFVLRRSGNSVAVGRIEQIVR